MSTQNYIPKNRLEAFSDGVIAIIITIMVLELRVPHGNELIDLKPLLPMFLSYVLSFIYLAIYWNNHHHLVHAAKRINAKIMWSNLHLLFWLSLVPFTTDWLDENRGGAWPSALYGLDLFMAGLAYMILQYFILQVEGKDSKLAALIGSDWKGKISLFSYALAIVIAFYNEWISYALYIIVATMWLIPDKRIENYLSEKIS